MRLIDADALAKFVHENAPADTPDALITKAFVLAALATKSITPTIDAAPVVHGWWIEKEVSTESGVIESWQSAKCTRCNRFHTTPYSYYYTNYNYCPQCGAKMDGGEA